MKKLSILIPAFNAEKYLKECLDSVLSQEGINNGIEVLILNDGSTDGTLGIIKDYASRCDILRFISRENMGIGPTRNELIDNAAGEYLWFIDADDWIEKGSIAKVLNTLNSNDIDCLMLSFQVEPQSGNIKRYVYEGDYSNGIELTKAQIYNNSVWSRIYRTSIVRASGVRFGKYIMGEDFDFTFRLIPMLGHSACINEIVYHYVLRSNSATQEKSYEHRRKVADDSLAIILALQGYFDDFSEDEIHVLKQPFNDNLIAFIYSLIQQKHPLKYKTSIIKQLTKAGFIPIKPVVSATPKRVKFMRLVNNPVLRFAILLK